MIPKPVMIYYTIEKSKTTGVTYDEQHVKNSRKKGLNISTEYFLTAIVVIFILMVLTYGMTFFVPGGEYARTIDASGNPVLLISLGLANVDYGTWAKWSWKFQLLNLLMTGILLLVGLSIGY